MADDGSAPGSSDEAIASTDDRFLRIYLNDHWAGQAAGRSLAQRILGSNRESPLGEYMRDLLGEMDLDAELLREAMRRVGARRDLLKETAALTAERIGRLKPNGRLLSYSPLSRLVELEALSLGVEGKLAGWKVLGELAGRDTRLEGLDFGAAVKRARSQRTRVERFRLVAARRALVTSSEEG
jgi:hypothetical protein